MKDLPGEGNHTSLKERLVPSVLANAATAVVDSLKINSISEKVRRGRRMVVKRRNGLSEQIAEMANLIFVGRIFRSSFGAT